MNEKSKVVIGVVVVLLGTILVWYNVSQKPENGQVVTPAPENASGTTGTLTDEERAAIIKVPAATASQEEKDAYFKRMTEEAVDGISINVTKCASDPLVIRIKNKADLFLSNDGANDVTVDLDKGYKVPAHNRITIKAGFGVGPGLFGYGCNGKDGSGTGFVLVTD